ncbi:MAG: zf-HC2 domain-containing protein, partial [Bryobacteraceae bacterium]
MTCEQAKQHIAESLTGDLEAPTLSELRAHLQACEPCRDEARAVEKTWSNLDLLEDEEPGPA